jgi:hypothetical protein
MKATVDEGVKKYEIPRSGRNPSESEGKEPTSLTPKESSKISKLLQLDEEASKNVLQTLRKHAAIAIAPNPEIQMLPVDIADVQKHPSDPECKDLTGSFPQLGKFIVKNAAGISNSHGLTIPPDPKTKHVVGSVERRISGAELGSRGHIEQLADKHGQGILETKFQDDVSFVHNSIKLFHPISELLISHVHSLLQDYVLPVQIQQVNETGMEIPESIWQNASLLRYTRSTNKWLPVMKKLSYVKLAQHVNSSEKKLTGAGNPINVAKKAAYAQYIKACYTSEAVYMAAAVKGEDAKERSLLQKEKMQGQKYLYLVDKFGLGALVIWPTQLDSKPSIADWSVCRMRSLVDAIAAVDLANGSKLMTLTRFISGWIEKLLFGQMDIISVQNMMHAYHEKHGIAMVEPAFIEEKISCNETIEHVIQTLPPVITLGEGLPLYASSLATLYSGSYLDDEVIRAILAILTARHKGVFLVDAAICVETFDGKSTVESGYLVDVPRGTTYLVMVINWGRFTRAHWTLAIASAPTAKPDDPWLLEFYDSIADDVRKQKADRLVPKIIAYLLEGNPHLPQHHLALRNICSAQQVTDCGCGVAVILAAQQHFGIGKPFQHPILTKEMEDEIRGNFAKMILEAFWNTDQPDPQRVPANKEWLEKKGLTMIPTRPLNQPSDMEVCSTVAVQDKKLWLSKTGTTAVAKRPKKDISQWLNYGTEEETIANGDFLNKRLI